MRGGTVLVVEDELLIRMTLVDALGEAGFDVVEAGDGEAALRVLESGVSPALLITDLALSGAIDGAALATRLRSLLPGLAVIVTSGRIDSTDHRVADVVIPKPYSLAEVCAEASRLTGG